MNEHLALGERKECKQFVGKYRGTVFNNVDVEQRGRIQVIVPDVSPLPLLTWAMPSLPIGGLLSGMFSVPVIGSGVWVEFEQGDLDYPIWTGVFWGSVAEVPALSHTIPPGIPGIVIQTPLLNGLVISDVPGPTGGILIKSATGAAIVVNDAGILIQNGRGASILMTGPTVVINNGALTVLP
jgi:uncharacterized protein involved in type VI secretion and phage assembly